MVYVYGTHRAGSWVLTSTYSTRLRSTYGIRRYLRNETHTGSGSGSGSGYEIRDDRGWLAYITLAALLKLYLLSIRSSRQRGSYDHISTSIPPSAALLRPSDPRFLSPSLLSCKEARPRTALNLQTLQKRTIPNPGRISYKQTTTTLSSSDLESKIESKKKWWWRDENGNRGSDGARPLRH